MTKLTFLDISAPVLHISSGKFTVTENWKHKPMYHDGHFEIIIVITGKLFLQVDNAQFEINEDNVFTIPPYHHLVGYRDSPIGTQYFWFHFFTKPDGAKIVEINDPTDNSEISFHKNQAVLPLLFTLPSIEKSFVLANQVLDVAKNEYYTSLGVDYLLTELIIQLTNDYGKTLTGLPTTSEIARIEAIKDWTRANLSDQLKVSKIAEAFDLNPHYLAKIFKQTTNETVIQFINQLKMSKSQELLLRTNLPIKQIASMSFFSDEKRFMKAFKLKTSLTPTEFRKSYTRKFLDSSNFDPEVPISKDNNENYIRRFENK